MIKGFGLVWLIHMGQLSKTFTFIQMYDQRVWFDLVRLIHMGLTPNKEFKQLKKQFYLPLEVFQPCFRDTLYVHINIYKFCLCFILAKYDDTLNSITEKFTGSSGDRRHSLSLARHDLQFKEASSVQISLSLNQ